MNIAYRRLNIEDLHPDLFNDFNRYQEVTKCWRKQNGEWVLIDDWDNAQKKKLATVYLPGTIERGGTVYGAFDGEKIIGFFALSGNLIGSRKQYIRLISLHVTHEYRHKGIGKKLFLLCVDAAKKTGAQKLYISAHSSQESQAFYRAVKCVNAEEMIPELFELEPFDVHMEYILSEEKSGIDFTKITACGECCFGCKKKDDGICEGCIESDGNCKEWAESKGCPIHKCAKQHGVQFCGLCPEFPCDWLAQKITWNPNIVDDLTALAKKYKEQAI